jgi:serine/threonine protein kinase
VSISARYTHIRPLGQHARSRVELVHDALRGTEVARKHLPPLSPTALAELRASFWRAQTLLHPGLVRLFDLSEDARGPFYTMEAVPGVDLRSWCRRPRRPGADRPHPYTSTGAGSPSRALGAPPADPTGRPIMGLTLSEAAAGAGSGDFPTVAVSRAGVTGGPVLDDEGLAATLVGGPPSRGDETLDIERLAHALPQVLEALSFLHRRGAVHGGLKVTNILCERTGAVRLADAGLARAIGSAGAARGLDPSLAGCAAPEVIDGAPPGPAADMYALGEVLFELATGRPVFTGAPAEVLRQHLEVQAPLAGNLAPRTHPALNAACAALLRKSPDARPTIEELVPLLLEPLRARPPVLRAPWPAAPREDGSTDLRRVLTAELSESAGGVRGPIVLVGPPGSGASGLGAWLGEEAERSGQLVLHAGTRDVDAGPYAALAGAVADLAAGVGRRLPDRRARQLDAALEEAAAAFPVLEGLAPGRVTRDRALDRRRAFDALARLLDAAAREAGGAVLLLDDFERADADALALLDHLLEKIEAPLLVVGCLDRGAEETPAGRWLATRRGTARYEVAPGGPNGAPPPESAEVARLVTGLPDRARSTLAAVLASGRWQSTFELAAALERPAREVAETLARLGRDGLVRRTGFGDEHGGVEPPHPCICSAATRALGERAMSRAHERLSRALLGDRKPPAPHRTVRHLLAAGHTEEAVHHAIACAGDAEGRGAFGLAARMYEIAERAVPAQARTWMLHRAEALGRAARFREAAAVWGVLASGTRGRDAARARKRELRALLAAGEAATARDRLTATLERAGVRGATGGWVARRLAPTALRWLKPTSRLGRLWAPAVTDAGVALEIGRRAAELASLAAAFSPQEGERLLLRARAAFAMADETQRVAWCDLALAWAALMTGAGARAAKAAGRLRADASAVLSADATDSALLPHLVTLLDAATALRNGRWDEAARLGRDAAEALAGAGRHGSRYHLVGLALRAEAAWFGQQGDALGPACVALANAARDADDPTLRGWAACLNVVAAWRGGRFAEARLAAQTALRRTAAEPVTLAAAAAELTACLPAVYADDASAARRRYAEALLRAAPFRPLDSFYAGPVAALGALLEANAMRAGDPQASRARLGRLAKLARRAPPLFAGAAERALAYGADAAGRSSAAVTLLEQAERRADEAGRRLDAAIARYQLGRRQRGPEGAARMAEARRMATTCGFSSRLLEEDRGLREA